MAEGVNSTTEKDQNYVSLSSFYEDYVYFFFSSKWYLISCVDKSLLNFSSNLQG